MMLNRRPFWFVLALLALLELGISLPASAEPSKLGDPAEDLAGFNAHLNAIAEKCRAATVAIVIPGGSMGSGVIIDDKGLVLTAAHVLPKNGGDVVIVMSDGRQLKAKTLGVNHKVDSGMARIVEPGPFPTAEVAPSDTVWEGEWAIAFGHGGGVQSDRPAPMRLGRILHVSSGTSPIRWVTTDCTVISGDSGGPLFDLQGRVIGIHSNIGMSVLVNRHVPIQAFHAQWEDLLKPKKTITVLPMTAKPMIPGMQDLPGLVQREFERRLKDKDGDFKKKLEPFIDKTGRLNISPVQAAELLGRQDLIEELRTWQQKLEEREQRTKEIEGVNKDAKEAEEENDESDVSKQSKATQQLIIEKKRERLLDDIAEDLRKTHGKIADHVLSRYEPSVSNAGSCTVEIICRGRPVALGTIIREDGYIVTKASELLGPARVRIGDQTLVARIVNGNGPNDLALLKVNAEGLTPVQWAPETPALGSLLVVPDTAGKPLAMGIVGVAARPIPKSVNNIRIAPPPKPYLGIAKLKLPDNKGGDNAGIIIGEVPKGSPAAKAGVKPKDLLTHIDDQPIKEVKNIIDKVNASKIGDKLTFTVKRGEETLKIEVEVGTRKAKPMAIRPRDDSKSAAQVYSARGGKLSKRRTGLALAMTHDAIIWSEDIGGPVLNLDGQAVGLNIARYGRTATYAIPADHAKQLIEKLMRGR